MQLRGTRAVGREQRTYVLWLVVTDRNIYTLETMGPDTKMEPLLQDLDAAARTLRVRR